VACSPGAPPQASHVSIFFFTLYFVARKHRSRPRHQCLFRIIYLMYSTYNHILNVLP
jgi:hypothetical protein